MTARSPNRRRVAFFAYYFPPLGGAGSRRALSFARDLGATGWDVTVFTPREGVYGHDPSLDAGGLPGVTVVRTESFAPAAVIRRLRGPEEGGDSAATRFIEEVPLGPVGRTVRGLARRLLYFPDASRGWIRHAVNEASDRHRADPFDVVLSSSPPVSAHLAGERFARAARRPLVLDVRDLWEPAIRDPRSRAGRLWYRLLGRAAGVLAVSEGYAASLREGATSGPVAVAYNGFDPGTTEAAVSPDPGDAAEPYLIHGGTTYPARQDFRTLADAVGAVRSGGGRLRLLLVGRVDDETRAALDAQIAAGSVEVLPFMPSRDLAALNRGARATIAFAWSGPAGDPICEGHLPAKLFESLADGAPVLLLAEPGTEAYRVGEHLGLEPRSPTDGVGLRTVVEALARGETPRGMTPRPTAVSEFTRRTASAVVEEVLRSVTEPPAT